MLLSLDNYLHAKNQTYPLVLSSDIADQRNSAIWLKEKHNWLHPTKSGNHRCYLHLINNSMQKTKIKIYSFERHWWSKNSVIWLDKSLSIDNMTISMMANSMHKKLRTKTIFIINSSEWFPDLAEISSYLEKRKYVTWIQNNQAFISYQYQKS